MERTKPADLARVSAKKLIDAIQAAEVTKNALKDKARALRTGNSKNRLTFSERITFIEALNEEEYTNTQNLTSHATPFSLDEFHIENVFMLAQIIVRLHHQNESPTYSLIRSKAENTKPRQLYQALINALKNYAKRLSSTVTNSKEKEIVEGIFVMVYMLFTIEPLRQAKIEGYPAKDTPYDVLNKDSSLNALIELFNTKKEPIVIIPPAAGSRISAPLFDITIPSTAVGAYDRPPSVSSADGITPAFSAPFSTTPSESAAGGAGAANPTASLDYH